MSRDLSRRAAYDFHLPEEQIAAEPPEERGTSRLLVIGEGLTHGHFPDVVGALAPKDLLVVNRVRVKPCRLEARKDTGGRVELLVLGRAGQGRARCIYKTRRKLREGQGLDVLGETEPIARVEVERIEPGGQAVIALVGGDLELDALMERAGEMPLPPYIVKRREVLGMPLASASDRERYQTVYAEGGFAVAAPTAGLHFTEDLLEALSERGVERASVRLDVGVGTFTPIRTEDLDAHEMHAERYVIEPELVEAVARTRERGGRVVAVGTTVVRALEDQMSRWGALREGEHEARLFIRPGYRFGAVDGMITNFHLPGSTLIAMVCAFGGYERMMAAYDEAIRAGYRFYSYGDAMLIWPKREGA